MKNQLKIMSFNLRVDTPVDGINAFSKRYQRVIDTIRSETPDLIGFQEATPDMTNRLRQHLPEYTFQGCGRSVDCTGEAMVVAYQTSDVALISLENFWLSNTPHAPGSTYGGDQSRCPRMAIALKVKHKDFENPFYFINTHLDHKGEEARYLGSVQLVQYISELRAPVILTGDFNALPETREIKIFESALQSRGMLDCSKQLGGTYHGYGALADPIKIDYIFSDMVCEDTYIVQDVPVNGQYYSDHNAICALLKL